MKIDLGDRSAKAGPSLLIAPSDLPGPGKLTEILGEILFSIMVVLDREGEPDNHDEKSGELPIPCKIADDPLTVSKLNDRLAGHLDPIKAGLQGVGGNYSDQFSKGLSAQLTQLRTLTWIPKSRFTQNSDASYGAYLRSLANFAKFLEQLDGVAVASQAHQVSLTDSVEERIKVVDAKLSKIAADGELYARYDSQLRFDTLKLTYGDEKVEALIKNDHHVSNLRGLRDLLQHALVTLVATAHTAERNKSDIGADLDNSLSAFLKVTVSYYRMRQSLSSGGKNDLTQMMYALANELRARFTTRFDPLVVPVASAMAKIYRQSHADAKALARDVREDLTDQFTKFEAKMGRRLNSLNSQRDQRPYLHLNWPTIIKRSPASSRVELLRRLELLYPSGDEETAQIVVQDYLNGNIYHSGTCFGPSVADHVVSKGASRREKLGTLLPVLRNVAGSKRFQQGKANEGDAIRWVADRLEGTKGSDDSSAGGDEDSDSANIQGTHVVHLDNEKKKNQEAS